MSLHPDTINELRKRFTGDIRDDFASVVARVEVLRGRMAAAGRQVERLFESLLVQSFSS